MKNNFKTFLLAIAALFLLAVATCNAQVTCPGSPIKFGNSDLLQIYCQLKNGPLPISGTVTATGGNWYRQDSATKANNFNREYLFSIDNSLTILANWPFYRQDSATANNNSLLKFGGYSVFKSPNGSRSVFWNSATQRAYWQSQANNSAYFDTISGKNYSVANELQMIRTGTVTTSDTKSSNISARLDTLEQYSVNGAYGTYGTQKIVAGAQGTTSATATTTLTTVSAGKTYFVTSVSVEVINSNSGADLRVDIKDNAIFLKSLYVKAINAGTNAATQKWEVSFPTPIRVSGPLTLTVSNGQMYTGVYSITGYEK